MINCNLTKPEGTFDQVRKTYEDLKPVDAALIGSAIAETGHMALVLHDGETYNWPEDQEKLAKALLTDIQAAQESEADSEAKPKKASRAKSKAKSKIADETVIRLSIPIVANQKAGEALLGKRRDLKTLLGQILKEGVEFLHTPTDIRWRWALERVNWSTVSGGDLPHHVVFTPEFADNCVGVELGPGGKRRKTKKSA
ncbi:MAG TPA: hypothetical protein VNI20_06775 [Fimbriimonadaceae bacterium]|nr:hypothetical protein [Fimbriimonadaceae bacterium]